MQQRLDLERRSLAFKSTSTIGTASKLEFQLWKSQRMWLADYGYGTHKCQDYGLGF